MLATKDIKVEVLTTNPSLPLGVRWLVTPEHAAYGDIQAPLAGNGPRYRDAWPLVHHHQPHTPTFCVHSTVYSKTPYCCDFAFVSDSLAERVRSIEVDSATQDSDHQPMLIEIDDR